MPDIAARDLHRIPDRQPEDLNLLTVVDRLARLERNMSKYNDTLSELKIEMLELKDLPRSFSSAVQSAPQNKIKSNNRPTPSMPPVSTSPTNI